MLEKDYLKWVLELEKLTQQRLVLAQQEEWDALTSTEETFHTLVNRLRQFSEAEVLLFPEASPYLTQIIANEKTLIELVTPKLGELKEFLIKASRRPTHGFNTP